MSTYVPSDNPFALSAEDLARIDAIREALLDPSPRRIGRLDQWGVADEYEIYAEIAEYREVRIGMADGTLIDAALSVPRNLAPGQTCPTVVLPAPLIGIGRNAYLGMLPRWSRGGYAVLAYSQRGLADSDGEIHVAGPQDVADASEVIDWLAGHDVVDRDRIGFFGSSYGAGTSLLVAAKDQRVKAVAGTSAWGDLFTSLHENGTRHLKAFEALVQLFGEERCSKEFRRVIEKIRANTIDDEVREFARVRSPRQYLEAYNHARTPILLTTAWHETIFSVPAVIDLFSGLTGAKSLLVQVGDHGNGELPGLFGLISKPTEMAYRWMDQRLPSSASAPSTCTTCCPTCPTPTGRAMPCPAGGSTSPARPPDRAMRRWPTASPRRTGPAPSGPPARTSRYSSPPSWSRPAWPSAWACPTSTRRPRSTASWPRSGRPRRWSSPCASRATWRYA